MSFITFRRHYIDKLLLKTTFYGKVLDVGGKKDSKRGCFRPPLDDVEIWEYLNIDKNTNPDYICSADNILIDDESFEMILLTEVLEHLENPIKVLNECKRILKKDGKLIATIPFLYALHADPYDFQRWTNVKIRMELKKLGFKNIKIESMGSLFAVTYDLFHISLNKESKNRHAIKNKLIRRLIMPILAKLFLSLDIKYMYKSKAITTGYYIEATK